MKTTKRNITTIVITLLLSLISFTTIYAAPQETSSSLQFNQIPIYINGQKVKSDIVTLRGEGTTLISESDLQEIILKVPVTAKALNTGFHYGTYKVITDKKTVNVQGKDLTIKTMEFDGRIFYCITDLLDLPNGTHQSNLDSNGEYIYQVATAGNSLPALVPDPDDGLRIKSAEDFGSRVRGTLHKSTEYSTDEDKYLKAINSYAYNATGTFDRIVEESRCDDLTKEKFSTKVDERLLSYKTYVSSNPLPKAPAGRLQSLDAFAEKYKAANELAYAQFSAYSVSHSDEDFNKAKTALTNSLATLKDYTNELKRILNVR